MSFYNLPIKQECIPVGCVPTADIPCPGVFGGGWGLPPWSEAGVWMVRLTPCGQNDTRL